MTEPAEDKLMTVQDVARKLKVSPMSVYRLVRSGDLTASDIGTGGERSRFRISEASLTAFLEGTRVAQESA